MIHAQNGKTLTLISPVAGSAGATYAATFDTLGYDYAMITVPLGTSGTSATDNPSVFKLGHGSVTNVSSHTNISGSVGDTDWTIPVAAAATNLMLIKLGADTKARQRYLSLSITLGAATNIAATVELSRAAQVPTTAALQGADALVLV